MIHDIVIRGGLVVDGTGSDPRRADVAIDGDRVVAVGAVDGAGRRELDADGLVVTPGFVDPHTHLDAQVGWDPLLTSSCWHGITSVVLGSCGVTFAPCRPGDRRWLAELMEAVEDIPADAIMGGLPWSWDGYGGYLDFLESAPRALNVGGMVGHSAVRAHAMGERCLDESPATDDDIAAMRALVAEAMDAGALGFSSSRYPSHRVNDGRSIPGTFADRRELVGLVGVLGERGRGVFQVVPAFAEHPDAAGREMALLEDVAVTSGRPVTFTLVEPAGAPTLVDDILTEAGAARSRGAQLWPQTTARSVGLLYCAAHRTPFDRAPAWRALRELELDERLAVMRDPGGRRQLIESAREVPPRLDLQQVYVMTDGDARYEFAPEDSLAAHAARRGVDASEAFIDLTVARDGRQLLVWPMLNGDTDTVERMLRSDVTMLGLADAGAHVGSILDVSQPTYFLTHWVRDRQLTSLADAVRRLTSQPATLFGIADRGVLRPGAYADVNVLDIDGMRLPQPELRRDFPGGAARYVQRARGYRWTLVNGEVLMDDGEHTGALPGRVVRGG